MAHFSGISKGGEFDGQEIEDVFLWGPTRRPKRGGLEHFMKVAEHREKKVLVNMARWQRENGRFTQR